MDGLTREYLKPSQTLVCAECLETMDGANWLAPVYRDAEEEVFCQVACAQAHARREALARD